MPLSSGKVLLFVKADFLYADIASYRREMSQQAHLPDDSQVFARHLPKTLEFTEDEDSKRQKQMRNEHLEFLTQQAQDLNMGYE